MRHESDEQFLAKFRQYLSEHVRTAVDVCSVEQGVSFARMMSETMSTPLAELTVAKIKEFKRNLRRDARLQGSLRCHRAFLAIQYLIDFRKECATKLRSKKPR